VTVSFWKDEKVLEIDSEMVVLAAQKNVSMLNALEMVRVVDFMLCTYI
jgi:hypothetical protein